MSTSADDLVVIGSGPAGQKGAIVAAKARKRLAVIDLDTHHARSAFIDA